MSRICIIATTSGCVLPRQWVDGRQRTVRMTGARATPAPHLPHEGEDDVLLRLAAVPQSRRKHQRLVHRDLQAVKYTSRKISLVGR